jgi:hypothetical protein
VQAASQTTRCLCLLSGFGLILSYSYYLSSCHPDEGRIL